MLAYYETRYGPVKVKVLGKSYGKSVHTEHSMFLKVIKVLKAGSEAFWVHEKELWEECRALGQYAQRHELKGRVSTDSVPFVEFD